MHFHFVSTTRRNEALTYVTVETFDSLTDAMKALADCREGFADWFADPDIIAMFGKNTLKRTVASGGDPQPGKTYLSWRAESAERDDAQRVVTDFWILPCDGHGPSEGQTWEDYDAGLAAKLMLAIPLVEGTGRGAYRRHD